MSKTNELKILLISPFAHKAGHYPAFLYDIQRSLIKLKIKHKIVTFNKIKAFRSIKHIKAQKSVNKTLVFFIRLYLKIYFLI